MLLTLMHLLCLPTHLAGTMYNTTSDRPGFPLSKVSLAVGKARFYRRANRMDLGFAFEIIIWI